MSLRRNFSWAAAGTVADAASKWGCLVVLAQLASVEQVGEFALALAITSPVIVLANLHLRAVQATDVAGQFRFADYLALRLLSTLAALLAIAALALAGSYPTPTRLVVVAVGFWKGVEAISDIYFGLAQQQQRMDRVGWSLLIKGPLALAALGAGVCWTGTAFWGVVGMAVVSGGVLLAYDVRTARPAEASVGGPLAAARKRNAGSANLRSVVRLVALAAPMGLVVLLDSVAANLPRYFLGREAGLEALGFFAAVSYVPIAAALLVTALGQAVQPRLALLVVERSPELRGLVLRLAGVTLGLGLLAALGCLVFGGRLLGAIYGDAFAHYGELLAWLMAGASLGFAFHFFDCWLIAARRSRLLVAARLTSLLAMAGVMWLPLTMSPLAVVVAAVMVREAVRLAVVALGSWSLGPREAAATGPARPAEASGGGRA